MDTFKKLLITGAGTGYSPVMPGTVGSIPPVLIWGALSQFDGRIIPSVSMLALAGLSSWICIALGGFAERTFGKKDPGQTVIDEWAGQAVTLIALPVAATANGVWITGLLAFLGFRFFDIIKPPPIQQIQRIPKGTGILLDDIMAGILANIACQIILRMTALGTY